MEQETLKFLNKIFILAVILIAGVLIYLASLIGYQSRYLDQQNQNQITVSGEGKVYAKPDVAMVSLGVKADGATVADVTKSGTDKMNAVIAAIKKLGIDDKDIQTTNYSLSPVYSNTVVPLPAVYSLPMMPVQSSSKLTGYTLEQDVQVKIRDFTKIPDVLSEASTSGANVVGDLQFTVDNPEQFKDQARAQAIAQAKTDAENMAKESGINLGKIINVYEGYSPVPVMYNSAKAMGGGVAESAPAPVIEPGQQEIDVTINLTYQVR